MFLVNVGVVFTLSVVGGQLRANVGKIVVP